MAMALRHRASQAQFLFCNLHRASTLPALSRSRSYYTDRDTLEPFHPIPGREPKICSSQEAVQVIESGNRVFIHSAAQCPRELVSSMIERGRRKEIHGVHVCHIHTEGPAEYAHAEFKGIFQANTFFTGANIRKDVQSGNADFTPIFLREIPLLFRSEALPVDVALISCSPPDKHGYCSLGVSVDVTRAALQSARVVIAQINRHVPRTFGDGFIHLSHFNYVVNQDEPLPESACPGETEADNMIGKHIAENLITDGACLQMYSLTESMVNM